MLVKVNFSNVSKLLKLLSQERNKMDDQFLSYIKINLKENCFCFVFRNKIQFPAEYPTQKQTNIPLPYIQLDWLHPSNNRRIKYKESTTWTQNNIRLWIVAHVIQKLAGLTDPAFSAAWFHTIIAPVTDCDGLMYVLLWEV